MTEQPQRNVAKLPPAKRTKRALKAEIKAEKTASLRAAEELWALFRARIPLISISTKEEARVEGYIAKVAAKVGYEVLFWDYAAGVTGLDGATVRDIGQMNEPDRVLRQIEENAAKGTRRTVWVLRDLLGLLGFSGTTVRRLRNLARKLPNIPLDRAQAVVLISASGDVPQDLAAQVVSIEWPLPDRQEIGALVDAAILGVDEALRPGVIKDLDKTRDAVVDAAIGLTADEAYSAYGRSLVTRKPPRIDPALIAAEKRRLIAQDGKLEWRDPLPGGLDAVGGLGNLKAWAIQRNAAFSEEARAYGLQPPRGALLVGPPGTGKSLSAGAIATAWNVPLIRLDMGALKAKWVGESEANLRRALKISASKSGPTAGPTSAQPRATPESGQHEPQRRHRNACNGNGWKRNAWPRNASLRQLRQVLHSHKGRCPVLFTRMPAEGASSQGQRHSAPQRQAPTPWRP